MKLSYHSKIRMVERAHLKKREQKLFFKEALLKGKSPSMLKDGVIKDFLLKKEQKCKVKLYKGFVFIYSKNSKVLYTMYKLPEELTEEEK